MSKEAKQAKVVQKVMIPTELFESILIGDKKCVHSFKDENLNIGDSIELWEKAERVKKSTGRVLYTEVSYIDYIKEPFDIVIYSIEIVGASNI